MSARTLKILAWHGFLTEFKLYAPIAILYFESVTGSFSLATAVMATGIIASTALEVPTGILSDRIGRKQTMILSAAGFVLYVLLMALAPNSAFLFAASLMAGLSDALASGNNNALLYETVKTAPSKQSFNETMGHLNALSQLALGLSAVGGGLLLWTGFSMSFLLWLSLIPQIMRTALCFFIVEPPHVSSQHSNIFHDLREAVTMFRKNPRLQLLTIANSIQFGIGEAAHRFGPAFFRTVWPLWAINAFSSARYILGALGFRLAAPVIAKWGEVRVLIGGSGLMAFFGILSVLLHNIASPPLVYMNSLLHGPNAVSREHLMQQMFTDRQRATMGSLAEFCSSLLTAGAIFVLGIIADRHGPAAAFLLAMILRLPVLWLYGRLFRHAL